MGFYCKPSATQHGERERGEIQGMPSSAAGAGGGNGASAGGTQVPLLCATMFLLLSRLISRNNCTSSFLLPSPRPSLARRLTPAGAGTAHRQHPSPSTGPPLGPAEAAPLRVTHGEVWAHSWGLQVRFFSLGLAPGRAQLQEVELLGMLGGNSEGFCIPQRNGGKALEQAGFLGSPSLASAPMARDVPVPPILWRNTTAAFCSESCATSGPTLLGDDTVPPRP